MITDIIAATLFFLGGIGVHYSMVRFLKPRETPIQKMERLQRQNEALIHTPGLMFTHHIPTNVLTGEQHLEYLCKTYPRAYNDYQKHHKSKEIISRADRHIMRLILAVNSGKLKAEIGSHTLDFENGDELWIANKYYGSYASLYRSKHNARCKYDGGSETISLYTFMCVVELEERLAEPTTVLIEVEKNK